MAGLCVCARSDIRCRKARSERATDSTERKTEKDKLKEKEREREREREKKERKKESEKDRKQGERARSCAMDRALTLQKGALRARCAERKTEKETL